MSGWSLMSRVQIKTEQTFIVQPESTVQTEEKVEDTDLQQHVVNHRKAKWNALFSNTDLYHIQRGMQPSLRAKSSEVLHHQRKKLLRCATALDRRVCTGSH